MMSDRIGLVGLVHVAITHHRGTAIAKRRDQYWKVLTVASVSYINESNVTLHRITRTLLLRRLVVNWWVGGGEGVLWILKHTKRLCNHNLKTTINILESYSLTDLMYTASAGVNTPPNLPI